MKAKQQGALDGLCGVYALVHFLRQFEYFKGYDDTSSEKEAFWCVLETAERLGLFKAHYVFEGYSGHNLRVILDQVFADLQLPYHSHLIPIAAKTLGVDKFKEFANRVLAKNGKLISSYSRDSHWIYVRKAEGPNLLIDNSSGITPRDQVLTPAQCGSIDLKDGVLILPLSVEVKDL